MWHDQLINSMNSPINYIINQFNKSYTGINNNNTIFFYQQNNNNTNSILK